MSFLIINDATDKELARLSSSGGKKSTQQPKPKKHRRKKKLRTGPRSIDFFDTVYSSLVLPKNPDDLPDPRKLLLKAIDADFDMSVFADHTFPRAANIIDWIRNPAFLNCSTKPYPVQFQTLVHFTKDVCYSCSDLDYIHNVPVDDSYGNVMDRFALLEHGVCPICQRNRTEILHEWLVDPAFHRYHDYDGEALLRLKPIPPDELCCIWGQRSGKSHTSSTFVATYHVHRYLALENPSAYFDEPANKVISGTFVAPSLKQIGEFGWTPFCDALRESPWFKEMVSYLRSEGKKHGLELFKSGQTFLNFPSKRLSLYMAAANSSNLRGGTRIISLLDELGWFNYDEEGKKRRIRDGSAIFRSLNNSLRTLRAAAASRRRHGDYDAITGIMVNISSPASVGDPIMRRAEVAVKNPRIYYTHHATWEVNPKQTEEAIRDEFAGEPEEDILRDFYAIPPKAVSPFFNDQTLLEDLVYELAEPDPPFMYKVDKAQDDSGLRTLQPTVVLPKTRKYNTYMLSVDNGEKKNSFALCLARYLPDLDGVYFEEFFEVTPYQGRSVDLAWAYENVIVPMVTHFNVLYVGYDIWQSAHAFYDLRTKHNTVSERYSLKWKDFDAFKHDLLGNKVRFNEQDSSIDEVLATRDLSMRARWPRSHCLAQILTVNVFNRKLFKPEVGNDDLFRVAVLSHRFINAYKKEFQKKTRYSVHGAKSVMGFKRANKPVPGSFNLPRAWYGKPNRRPGGLRGR